MVSIILLTRNKLELTRLCVDSIIARTDRKKTPYELIVVDNGSTDGTKKYLDDLKELKWLDLKTIYNDCNKGFPAANNQGAAIAAGDEICLINNDCIVTDGWLEKMLRVLHSDPKLAAVGPYTSRSASQQQLSPAYQYRNDDDLQKYSKHISQKLDCVYVDFLVFFCTLIKREAWDKLHGLDEDFTPGNYEDNYFCHQAIAAGYKLKIVDCYIHHFGSQTWNDKGKEQEYIELLARNQKKYYDKITCGERKTVALCMIVADYEKPETLAQCVNRAGPFVDQVNIVFNYKHFPSKTKIRKLLTALNSMIKTTGTVINYRYYRWTDFSDMRNKSLDMARADYGFKALTDYVLWLDTDDLLLAPQLVADEIHANPDTDSFKCAIICINEIKGEEVIMHNRLFKNRREYRFKNKVHEDITFSLREHNATTLISSIQIRHLGYAKWADTVKKNKRNLSFLEKEIKTPEAHSLTYFGIINCLCILGGQKNWIRAIKYIDEALNKFKLSHDDPLTQKMWVMRGLCCMSCGQQAAAKQSFLKAYDGWSNPEGAVNLAEIYMRENDYDQALEILHKMEKAGGVEMQNIPYDVKTLEKLMLFKLGECYAVKKDYVKAESYYRKCLFVVPDNLLAADRLCQVLRIGGKHNEAAQITINLINRYPAYHVGWFNMGQFELLNRRAHTAKLFFKKAVEINPKYIEAAHNLRQLELMERGEGGKSV